MRIGTTLTIGFILFYAAVLSGQSPLIDSMTNLYHLAESDSLRAARALELSAQTYRTDTELALEWGRRAVQHAQKAKNSLLEASSISTVGVAYYYQGNWEKAMDCYFRSLDIAEKNGHQVAASTTLGNIGLLYGEQNDHPKALAYLFRSLQSKIDLQDSIGIARSFANIGMVYSNRMMPDSAILFYEKQVALCDQLQEVYGKAIGLNNIGQVYMERGQYDRALDYLNQALEIKTALDDKNGMSVTLGNIGEIRIRQGQFQKAIDPLTRAVDLAKQANSLPKLEIPYQLLTQAFAGTGDYKKAYEYQSLLLSVKDSLNNKERLDRAEELEAKYQNNLQKAELLQRELTIERQDHIKNRILTAAVLLLLLLAGLFYRMRARQKIKQKEFELQAQIEHSEAEKLRELDAMKSAFFTNISHEFRTPLTLIISPLEQLINGSLAGNLQSYYQAMLRNGRRLLELVNQMLDLSKLEEGKMQLQVSPGDLEQFVRVVAGSFESLAERKQIRYVVEDSGQSRTAFFDSDKLEKILVNLISNAFKYTGDGEEIRVSVSMDDEMAHLVVADTGIGIPDDLQQRLFDRFFLTTQSDIQAGSGLGLALTRELVELHHGQIDMASREGIGTTFTVHLPILETAYGEGEVSLVREAQPVTHLPEVTMTQPGSTRQDPMPFADLFSPSNRPQVLVVEDHEEVRAYIVDQLKGTCAVLEARNGKEGLRIAEEQIPDLIISDVMMPEMSGTELCERLKSNEQTSHIPVILLTARAEQSDKLDGLIKGADDYLVKPFDVEELRTRVMNLIEQRTRLQDYYRRSLHVFSQHLPDTDSMDDRFLAKVREEVEIQMENEQFSVVELSQRIGMSRSQLHRKLTAMTGYSPNQVIRLMRLEKARHLIEQRWGTISEIAFACGFSSPAYFSKCFRERFGLTPVEKMEEGKSG